MHLILNYSQLMQLKRMSIISQKLKPLIDRVLQCSISIFTHVKRNILGLLFKKEQQNEK